MMGAGFSLLCTTNVYGKLKRIWIPGVNAVVFPASLRTLFYLCEKKPEKTDSDSTSLGKTSVLTPGARLS